MAKNVYECMFIFNANTYAKNPAGVAKTVEELIGAVDGEILASRLWNEQKLAYPIKGQRKRCLLANLRVNRLVETDAAQSSLSVERRDFASSGDQNRSSTGRHDGQRR